MPDTQILGSVSAGQTRIQEIQGQKKNNKFLVKVYYQDTKFPAILGNPRMGGVIADLMGGKINQPGQNNKKHFAPRPPLVPQQAYRRRTCQILGSVSAGQTRIQEVQGPKKTNKFLVKVYYQDTKIRSILGNPLGS